MNRYADEVLWWKILIAASFAAAAAWGGTFGTVVSIGGEASDLALDETRGVLYIANFTGNAIDVMSLATNTIQTSINVAAQPSSIAMSLDGHYLVATNYGNAAAPASAANALTVIDLTTQGIQTFALGSPPLGVAFGSQWLALVVTTTDFVLFNPSTGATQQVSTLANVEANTIPVAPTSNFPAQITAASVAASADGLQIYGLGGTTSTVTFRYDVDAGALYPGAIVTNSGILGPRVVSLNHDGSLAMAGWVMANQLGTFVNYFPQHSNQFTVGSTAFDDSRGLLYAQIPASDWRAAHTHGGHLQQPDAPTDPAIAREPHRQECALERFQYTLRRFSQRRHSSSRRQPRQQPRVMPQQQSMVFRGNFCNPGVSTKQVHIVDPGGNNTPFSISSNTAGVSVSPTNGVTPASVTVSVDPSAFGSQSGTVPAMLSITSPTAVKSNTQRSGVGEQRGAQPGWEHHQRPGNTHRHYGRPAPQPVLRGAQRPE